MLRLLTCLLAAASVLTACGATVPRQDLWVSRDATLIWPPPPNVPRIGYVRTLTGPQDFAGAEKGRGLWDWLTGAREIRVSLLTPVAVAADGGGRVWVADSSARMVYRFDLAGERVDYIRQVGAKELQAPSGVVFDPRRERLYIADAARRTVYVLGRRNELLGERVPPDGFGRPGGLALDADGRLYVADALRGEIFLFDADGALLRTIGSRATADGRFQRPIQLALGPQGELLVVDALRFLVEIQSAGGELLGTIGQLGDVPGAFARPRGIAVDTEGHVFVADAAFDNIQVFDLAGRLLMYWGGAGKGNGQFNLPAGLFIDDFGRLFVADSYNQRVQVFRYLGGATSAD